MADLRRIANAWHVEAVRRAEESDCGMAGTVSADATRREARKLLTRQLSLTPESEQTIAANGAGILEA